VILGFCVRVSVSVSVSVSSWLCPPPFTFPLCVHVRVSGLVRVRVFVCLRSLDHDCLCCFLAFVCEPFPCACPKWCSCGLYCCSNHNILPYKHCSFSNTPHHIHANSLGVLHFSSAPLPSIVCTLRSWHHLQTSCSWQSQCSRLAYR